MLAWHDDSRGALSGVGVARALVGIIEDYSEVKYYHSFHARLLGSRACIGGDTSE